eukprot:Awhi_evm1s13016
MSVATVEGTGEFIGELYNVKGKKLAAISLELHECNLTIEGKPVIVSVVPGGEEEEKHVPCLQIKSTQKVNNENEAVQKKIEYYEIELTHLKEELIVCEEKIKINLNKAEEEYRANKSEKLYEENKKKVGNEITDLLFKKAQLVNRIAEMEATTEVKVEYTIIGGCTVTLSPGTAAVVSFLPYPVFWIPYSLAQEKVNLVEKQIISVDLSGFEVPGYDSDILDQAMKRKISKLFPKQIGSMNMLYNEKKGLNASTFDSCVLGKG